MKKGCYYSINSMARTLMARLPWLFQTHSCVPWKKNSRTADLGYKGVFLFYIENGILCVLIRIFHTHS